MIQNIYKFQKSQKIRFKNESLLVEALTHKSANKNFNNLVGKARIIFFSSNKKKGSLFKFWNWDQIVRKGRLFKKIQ